MALPKLATAKYELQLPSTAETIKYRPFLVKEQKVLMMANESKDQKQVIESVKEIITNCTFGGSKNNELYITTALKGLKKRDIQKYHLSGSLFKVKTNIKGILSKTFNA